MRLETWWLFVLRTFVVLATPGPNMLLVMSSVARFGVGAVPFPAVFDTLRLAGAAYLVYQGVQS